MIANVTPPPIPVAQPVFEPAPDPAGVLDRLAPRIQVLQEEVGKVIIGQEAIISAALYALFARGHCLLVGVPGLAKTLLVHTLARSLELAFSRIQFTPDLMPSDITGTEILEEDTATGHRRFVFVRGPVFTQVLLADEINRTPPKTQAALLEAMQEKTVTVGGKIYRSRKARIRCPRRSSTGSCSSSWSIIRRWRKRGAWWSSTRSRRWTASNRS
jgi:MoxR-like ATPase